MTALLEFKQKIKGIYAQYEMYLLPLLKFVLALVYFIWINTNMGYMTALDNIFVVLILSLICCILPSGMMIFAGFALMVGHCYALGIEVAAFLLVLILFMMILFLRFSSGKNIVLVFTPLAFAFDIPVLLPIGCGLLSSAVSALPAAGGAGCHRGGHLPRADAPAGEGQRQQEVYQRLLPADGGGGEPADHHGAAQRSGVHQESGGRRAGGVHHLGEGGGGCP